MKKGKKETKREEAIRKATEYLEQAANKEDRPEGDEWFCAVEYSKATSQAESGARKKLGKLKDEGKLESIKLGNRRFYRPVV